MKNTKRFLTVLLSAALALSLAACAKAPAPELSAPAGTDAAAATKAPAEAAPADDKAAYDAAVEAVLAEYRALDADALENYDEAAHPELPWYTAVIANTVRNDLFCGFWDFDGNGTPELIVAAGDADYQVPEAIYAFDGTKMVYLCKEQPLGERSILTYKDGLFFVHASGGAAVGSVAVYRIAPDGYGTDLIEIMDYEYSDADHVTYTPELGGMTPEEFAAFDTVAGFHEPVEYTLFAARKG